MTKQLALAPDVDHLSDIPQDIRDIFIKQFEESDPEQQLRRDPETTPLLSKEETEQFNSAVENVADKLGITGDLATIDTLLKARSTRVARILTAAFGSKE